MLAEFPTVWESNCPLSLVDIAITCCLKNDILLQYSSVLKDYELKDGISLPREICERLIHIACELARNEHDRLVGSSRISRYLKIFQDVIRTRLSRVDLSNCAISDADLGIVCSHDITELNISRCLDLTSMSYHHLNRLSHSLLSLTIGTSINVFPDSLNSQEPSEEYEDFSEELFSKYSLDAPNIRKLVVEGLKSAQTALHFYESMKNMEYLLHLDLSRCRWVRKLDFICNHKHLVKLILFDVSELERCIDAIRTIPTLKYLDLSQIHERFGYYRNPNKVLKSLVQSLPNLIWLDISGTNLAGDRIQERDELDVSDNETITDTKTTNEDNLVTDIPGLKSRVNRPLEFLGLYKTTHDACYRHHIPAKQIAGEANHDQILTAGQAYVSRPEIIQKVLDDLFHMFRFYQCENMRLALDIIIEAMRQHIDKNHIQISGSASLFYIVKSEEKNLNVKVKQTLVKTLMDAMITHITDVTMIRNGCLTLIHFKIPDDVCFEYDRLVKLLLVIIAQEDQDEFVQRIGVYLLNSIACQVDGHHKQSVGDHGAIMVLLQVIASRLSHEYCDEVMETAWSTLWNVTDETPINSQRFLEGDGMTLFLKCLRTFPDKPELLRNMMGLLGNVAEVKELRKHLMTDEYLNVFSDLLTSKSDGIEVSYNAAGILSHIMSDGPELWNEHNISLAFRDAVLQRMVKAIDNWNLNSKRNINYRSFEPILRLLYVDDAPEAQYWAVWALANLTKVYPEKYCPLLEEEHGLAIIAKLYEHHPLQNIKHLASMILQNCDSCKIKLMIDDMMENKSDTDVIKDTCLRLIGMKLPDEILFEFERLANLLLDLVMAENQDSYIQQIVLYLMHKMLSPVDHRYKRLFAECGGITVMLQLISHKLMRECCDEVMVACWKVLLSATETARENCHVFLESDGIILFLKCITAFPDNSALIPPMLTTIGNVAEVSELRVHILSDRYINLLRNLMRCATNCFAIRFHAARVLINLASDAFEIWRRSELTVGARAAVLTQVAEAIESWDLDAPSPYSLSTLKPLISYLCMDHSPEVQYFAVWTICSCMHTFPQKFYPMLKEEEDSLPMIQRLHKHHQCLHIRELAMRIEQLYTRFMEEVAKKQQEGGMDTWRVDH